MIRFVKGIRLASMHLAVTNARVLLQGTINQATVKVINVFRIGKIIN